MCLLKKTSSKVKKGSECIQNNVTLQSIFPSTFPALLSLPLHLLSAFHFALLLGIENTIICPQIICLKFFHHIHKRKAEKNEEENVEFKLCPQSLKP